VADSLAAGLCIGEDERASVVGAPGQGKLTGRYAVNGPGGYAAQGDQGRIARCQQAYAPAVDQRLVGLVGAGDFGADQGRPAAAGIDG
jgi:hypothetical protein